MTVRGSRLSEVARSALLRVVTGAGSIGRYNNEVVRTVHRSLRYTACLGLLLACQSCGPAADQAPSACTTALEAASRINGSALFDGAVSCAQEKRDADTNFLIILGQVRSMPDMIILTPLDEANAEKASALYGRIFYQVGGLGIEAYYRAPENVTALEQRVRRTDLSLKDGYDPGWAFKSSSKTDIYDAVLSTIREQRLWQMRNMARMVQDDEYWAIYQAIAELKRQNPVFKEGTPAYDEAARLNAQLDEAAKDIPQEPPPPDTTPYARLNEPDPDLAKLQVAMGFNGPATLDSLVLRSEDELRGSWLAAALSKPELAALAERTDFGRQVLLVLSLGLRTNASGAIVLSELRAGRFGYSIGARIGVVPESCGASPADSYPFVVAVAEALPDVRVSGTSAANFPVACGPVVSGQPTPQ